MRKIINGRLYDTETAKAVGFWSNAGGWRDFKHIEETLYKKKTGEYFLYGEGGPMTYYAKQVDANNWSGGKNIEPLTEAGARRWAEEHLDADQYIEIFGEVEE